MAIAKGSKSELLWKVESSYGTAPTGNWNSLPLNNESLTEQIDTITSDDIMANRETPSVRGGNIAAGGSITHDLGPLRTLAFFAHMIGATIGAPTTLTAPSAIAVTTPYNRGDYVLAAAGGTIWCCRRGGSTPAAVAGLLTGTGIVELTGGTIWEYVAPNATSIYEYTLTPNVDFPAAGIAFEKAIKGGNSNLFLQWLGGRINGCELSVPQNGPVKATYNLLTKKPTKLAVTGAGTPTTVAEDFFTGFDAYVHLNDTQGAGGKVFQDFSASFSNNIDEGVYCIGERDRTDLPEGRKSYGGRLGMYFLDATEYDIFKNETEVSLMLTLIKAGRKIKIEWPEVKLTGSGAPTISGQGAITQSFDWTAFYQDGAQKPWRITATNLQATMTT
jgi:hypothetical protein